MLLLFLLFASLSGAVAALVLAVRGLVAVRNPHKGWLRAAALLAASGAVSVYVWGMLHVTWAVLQAEDGGTDSSPPMPCRAAGDQVASRYIGYDVGYLPLRFDCRLDNGTTYTPARVPGYVNPATALLAVTAVICGVEHSNRQRRTTPSGARDSGTSPYRSSG